MSDTREKLTLKSNDEVKAVADKLGIKPHPQADAADIINQIEQQPQAYVRDAMKHAAEEPKAPSIVNTEAQVREVIKAFLAKDGFEAKFIDDGQTWSFKYKGAEDTGSMSVPLRVIRQKAEFVSQGRRMLRVAGADSGFETNVRPGKYADNVLM